MEIGKELNSSNHQEEKQKEENNCDKIGWKRFILQSF